MSCPIERAGCGCKLYKPDRRVLSGYGKQLVELMRRGKQGRMVQGFWPGI